VNTSSRSGRAIQRGSILLASLFVLAACSSTGSGSPSASPSSIQSSGASASATASAAPASLKFGVAPAIFSYLPTYVALDKGFWADQNLDVSIAVLNSGTDLTQALTGDAIDFAAASYNEPIVMTSQGVPAVNMAIIEGALPYRFMGAKGITDINQLVGKTVGVSKIGSLSDQVSRIVLNKAGVDLNSVKFQGIGGSPARLAALESGAIQAAVLDSPSYELAQQAGANILVNVAQQLEGFPYETLIAKKATIEANRDVFVRVLVGYIKGAQYATDPANEDEVIAIVSKYTGQKVEDLKVAYKETIKDFPADGRIDPAGIALSLKGAQDYAGIKGADALKAEDLIDSSLQEEAAKILGLK
jgi:NitT/TauT family transport system substrate-binding protein